MSNERIPDIYLEQQYTKLNSFINLSTTPLLNDEIDYNDALKSYKKYTHKQIKKINNNIL